MYVIKWSIFKKKYISYLNIDRMSGINNYQLRYNGEITRYRHSTRYSIGSGSYGYKYMSIDNYDDSSSVGIASFWMPFYFEVKPSFLHYFEYHENDGDSTRIIGCPPVGNHSRVIDIFRWGRSNIVCSDNLTDRDMNNYDISKSMYVGDLPLVKGWNYFICSIYEFTHGHGNNQYFIGSYIYSGSNNFMPSTIINNNSYIVYS